MSQLTKEQYGLLRREPDLRPDEVNLLDTVEILHADNRALRAHLTWAMDNMGPMQILLFPERKTGCRYCRGFFNAAGDPKKRRVNHKSDCHWDAAHKAASHET